MLEDQIDNLFTKQEARELFLIGAFSAALVGLLYWGLLIFLQS